VSDVVSLVNAYHFVCQLKHVVSETNYDELTRT
jgi:hypothetical protein